MVAELVRLGKRVRVLDNFSTGTWENLERIVGAETYIQMIEGDINNRFDVSNAMNGASHVYHLAALTSVQGSTANPCGYEKTNVLATVSLLEEAFLQKIKRFIFASSCSIYGNNDELLTESWGAEPESFYAFTKASGEGYCDIFRSILKVPTTSLRLFNVFGPRQKTDGGYPAVIPAFIKSILSGKQPTIYGNGEQTRDFIFVETVAKAFVAAANLPSGRVPRAINVCSGSETTLNYLFAMISKICGSGVVPKKEPARVGDVEHSLGDATYMHTLLKLEIGDLEEQLEKTVRYYQGQQ